jgi:hypothetical protein
MAALALLLIVPLLRSRGVGHPDRRRRSTPRGLLPYPILQHMSSPSGIVNLLRAFAVWHTRRMNTLTSLNRDKNHPLVRIKWTRPFPVWFR